MTHKDLAHKDSSIREPATPAKRLRKAAQATPMAQQRPDDYGASSAPQRLVRLVGCCDPHAQDDRTAHAKRKAVRSRQRHRIAATE